MAGGYMHNRAATTQPLASVVSTQRAQVVQRAMVAASVTCLLLVLALTSDLMGLG